MGPCLTTSSELFGDGGLPGARTLVAPQILQLCKWHPHVPPCSRKLSHPRHPAPPRTSSPRRISGLQSGLYSLLTPVLALAGVSYLFAPGMSLTEVFGFVKGVEGGQGAGQAWTSREK